MRIDFTKVSMHSSEVDKTSHKSVNAKENLQKDTQYLDISGIVKDNAVFGSSAYDGQGMTVNEYLQENGAGGDLAAMGAGLPSLRKNYLAVMSNSLSTEDFAKLRENGYQMGSMEIKDAVSVIEQIKVKLIEAGIDIAGFTDTISDADIDKITDNPDVSRMIKSKLSENDVPVSSENVGRVMDALSMVSQIADRATDDGLNDDTIKSLLISGAEPTIENVFMCAYGSSSSQSPKVSNDYSDIYRDIEKIIERAGLAINDETISDAEWILDNNIPLSEDTLNELTYLKSINPKSKEDLEKLIDNIADAINHGLSAKDASMITNRRVLLEAQLKLTADANLKLIESDYSIDTKDLEKEISNLRLLEEKLNDKDASIEEKILYSNLTSEKINDITKLPIDLVAQVQSIDAFTINDVYESGIALKATYDRANESYEALRTEIRSDLGDNIRTAFRNIGEMLKEMHLPDTDANERAVRILGYNQMEVTEENIFAIRNADQEILRMIDRMSPANVLRMIKEGVNPLEKSVQELNVTLDSYNDDKSKNESYSEFLVKLEHNKEISEEQKNGYIGIYRLIRQIEKSDGAVIGNLVNAGAELSFKNLISAIRSRKASGIDVTINDSFGFLEDLPEDLSKIDTEIAQAFEQSDFYKKETSDLLSVLDPEKLHRMWEEGNINSSTTIDDLYEGMINSEADDEATDAYYQQQAEYYRDAYSSDADIENLLESYDIPKTYDNYAAVAGLFKSRGSAFKKLSELIEKSDNDKKDVFTNLIDALTDPESMQEAYERLADETRSSIDKQIADSALTAKELRMMMITNDQVVIMKNLSKEENYEVPIETESGFTSINLKIVRDGSEPGVVATMSIPYIGDLVAHMLVDDENVSGYMMAETDEGVKLLSSVKKELDEMLNADIVVTKKSKLEINKRAAKSTDDNKKSSDTLTLYRIAKAFVKSVGKYK